MNRIKTLWLEPSRYNLRFMQRRRMKELLGKKHRPLVEMAKGFTQVIFLEQLTSQQAYVIRQLLHMEPTEFWRACRGKSIHELPEQPGPLDERVLATMADKPKQLVLPLERPRTREDFVRERPHTE